MSDTNYTTPSGGDVARFLRCFEILGQFEAQQQFVRGGGAFDPAEWPDKPDPAVLRVIDWLRETFVEGGHSG